MERQNQQQYNNLLHELAWKGSPADQPEKMKKFIDSIDVECIVDGHYYHLLGILGSMARSVETVGLVRSWEMVLDFVERIWHTTPEAFGRFYLQQYYQNNESAFGSLLRRILQSIDPSAHGVERGV